MEDCLFCKPNFTMWRNIDRKFYEDKYTIALLAQGQEVRGYSLVILKKHYTDLATFIPHQQRGALIKTVNRIAFELKRRLGAERIYVASLCDGVEHLHFHLIPRYKWTEDDKERYRETFKDSRPWETIESYIIDGKIGGFWWLAGTETGALPPQETEQFDRILLKDLEGI